jgi:hypothetical protein
MPVPRDTGGFFPNDSEIFAFGVLALVAASEGEVESETGTHLVGSVGRKNPKQTPTATRP